MGFFILIIAIVLIIFFVIKNKSKKRKERRNILDQYKPVIHRAEQIINESIDIAKKSKNYKTAMSRIDLAEEKVKEIEQISNKYPFLDIGNFEKLRSDVSHASNKIMNSWYDKLNSYNAKGGEFEKNNEVDKAIKVYKKAVQADTDTPHTYKRLAILYRKRKDYKNEKRILNKAIKNAGSHWFDERLKKLEEKGLG